MKATQDMVLDLARPGRTPSIHAVQGDSGSRTLLIALRCDGRPWPVPEGVGLLIRYRKPDGTGGTYDTLPDGSRAWKAEGNLLEVTLAPQVCTVPGKTAMELTLIRGLSQLTTFRLEILVSGRLVEGEDSGEYTNLAAWLEENGKEGVGIASVVQTTVSDQDGGENIITVTKTDGTSSTFRVKNGSGGGSLSEADMDAIAARVRRFEIGDVFASLNPTSPAARFGGTWEQITGRFLLGAGGGYEAGSTGGEAASTLTIDHLPSHNHMSFLDGNYGMTNGVGAEGTSSAVMGVDWNQYGGSYSRLQSNFVGGSRAHNNMPPYKAYYLWERVA